ncbi:MAG: PAS domain-containing protein [Gammaproteobacteria bacterium]|nr:PAS domain-containing protein [Gammaproteobacteria bacterium]
MNRSLAEEHWHAIVAGTTDALFCVDPVHDSSGEVNDFCIAELNDHGARLLRQTKDQLMGKSTHDLFSTDQAPAVRQRLREALSSGESSAQEVEIEIAGDTRYIFEQLIPLESSVMILARDVTDSRRDQEALRDSQAYLRSVIENVPIIIYELDRQGVFKLSAGRSLAAIGLTGGEAVGSSMSDFFPKDSPEGNAFLRALQGETVSTETQLGDGLFASLYTPRRDEEGNIVGVLGVSYDITERRQAELQLQHAHRMEAVGQLTGGIAHDFNNLLAVTLGNLDLLEYREDLDDDARQLISNALNATNRGAVLTQRLLAFSRQQLLEPRPTDANHLINGMLNLLNRTLPETIDVAFEPAEGLWATHVDPSQLESAILNLCVNARDAMTDGGTLAISTHNTVVSADEAERLGIPAGDYVELSVADTGSGISEELRSRIFEPFFTTKEVGAGSGLGLSMVLGFVGQSGGTVQVDGGPGKGTRMSLLLPRSSLEQESAVPAQDSSTDAAPSHGERILVVEDDSDVRALVTRALSDLGYDVLDARQAGDALTILKEHDVDLLFTDIVLPGGMSGLELAREARAAQPGLKLLLTTGYARDAAMDVFESVSGVELIAKPFRIADLGRKFRTLLDR